METTFKNNYSLNNHIESYINIQPNKQDKERAKQNINNYFTFLKQQSQGNIYIANILKSMINFKNERSKQGNISITNILKSMINFDNERSKYFQNDKIEDQQRQLEIMHQCIIDSFKDYKDTITAFKDDDLFNDFNIIMKHRNVIKVKYPKSMKEILNQYEDFISIKSSCLKEKINIPETYDDAYIRDNLTQIKNNYFTILQTLDFLENNTYVQFNDTNQKLLADMIYAKNFGQNTVVLKALIQMLGKIKITNQEAQYKIANAIYKKKFGEYPAVQLALVENLTKMSFSDAKAQREIIFCIRDKKFGDTIQVREKIAEILPEIVIPQISMSFDNQGRPYSQLEWAMKAIICDNILINPEDSEDSQKTLYKNLANSINKIEIKNTDILYQMFFDACKNIRTVEFQQHVLENLNPIFFYSDNDFFVRLILIMINNNYFIKHENISKHIFEILNNIIIINPKIQIAIVKAIFENKLGNYNNTSAKLEKIEGILKNSIVSLKTYEEMNKNTNNFLSQNSNYRPFGVIQDTSKAPQFKYIEDNIIFDACFENKSTYSVIKDTQGKPKLLIVYNLPDEETATNEPYEETATKKINIINCLFNFKKNDFLEYRKISSDLLKKIQIFDLSNLKKNHPTLIDNLTETSEHFFLFPKWLQLLIHDDSFDIQDFKSQTVLDFLLKDISNIAFSKEKNQLKEDFFTIVKEIIKRQGENFNISSDPEKDMLIKDAINCEMMNNLHDHIVLKKAKIEYQNLVDKFWNASSKKNKLKLTYLLGTLAKNGSLGYDYYVKDDQGNKIEYNRANFSLYLLFQECIKKLIKEEKEEKEENQKNEIIKKLTDLDRLLESGTCIEKCSYDFTQIFPEAIEVFDRLT